MPDPVLTEQEQQAESAAKAAKTEQDAASAAAESETQPDKPEGEGGEPPKKGGVQRRIDELTRGRRLAEAETEFWKSKALSSDGKQPSRESPPASPTKPNPSDFETTEAYLDARDEWVKRDTLRGVEERIQKSEQARTQQSEAEILSAEWGERESTTQEKHADYEAVTAQAMESFQESKGPGTNSIAHAIQYSEAGPEILYYLGQHPEEARRLFTLHPTQAVIAVGRIEERLALETTGGEAQPPQPRVPKPPTPIRKVAPRDDGDLRDDLSPEEWRKRYLKKMETK